MFKINDFKEFTLFLLNQNMIRTMNNTRLPTKDDNILDKPNLTKFRSLILKLVNLQVGIQDSSFVGFPVYLIHFYIYLKRNVLSYSYI